MVGRGAPLLAAALLTLGAAGLAAPKGSDSMGCGNLAPFVNACAACCQPLGPAPNATANLLGFAGALEMRLEGAAGAWVWRCWTLAVDEPLPHLVEVCTGPSAENSPPLEGDSVSLHCLAGPHDVDGAPVGPAGPWGCRGRP